MERPAGPVFVQLPHPKDEHNPRAVSRQPWNTGEHRRKFIRGDGRYVARDGSLGEAPLVFWGEWEAPSYVIDRRPAADSLPRCLHDPVWEHPKYSDARQNTDPWVFGDCFRYSNCKQFSQRALRKLARGSVILFGSTLNREFVVDTLFVVRDSCPFVPNRIPPDTDDAFRICTIEALRTDKKAAGFCFTLYRGATYDTPVNGLYSFVPCRRANGERSRFHRPSVSLPLCYVNPKDL